MNKSQTQTMFHNPLLTLKKVYDSAGGAYIFFIAVVLLVLEAFSFSTTKYALQDLLGEVAFGFTSWAAILAIAFCGMDLIGAFRLFTPQTRESQGSEGWFLLGAWLVAAVMNTGFTWWGISIAIYNHPVESVLVIDPMTIVTVIPIFVAIMILLIRILIIGNLTGAINRALAETTNTSGTSTKQPFGFRSKPAGSTGTYVRRSTVPQGTHVFSARSQIDN